MSKKPNPNPSKETQAPPPPPSPPPPFKIGGDIGSQPATNYGLLPRPWSPIQRPNDPEWEVVWYTDVVPGDIIVILDEVTVARKVRRVAKEK